MKNFYNSDNTIVYVILGLSVLSVILLVILFYTSRTKSKKIDNTTPCCQTPHPKTIQPGTSQPGTQQPGTSQPGTQQPGTSHPETSHPETSQPVTPNPETNIFNFIYYCFYLNINWNLKSIYLETFQIIQDQTQKYNLKDLFPSSLTPSPTLSPNIVKLNEDIKKKADDIEMKNTGTSIFKLTDWGKYDEYKMFVIIYYVTLIKKISGKSDFKITQDFINCMYHVLDNYTSPSDLNNNPKLTQNVQLNKCFDHSISNLFLK